MPARTLPEGCPCGRRARRRCDLCPEEAVLACSLRCLQAHLGQRHPRQAARATADRLADYQRQVNRLGQAPGVRVACEAHRQRLMRLCTAVQRGPGICVLGAGNGSDLDLPLLVRAFGEVHLVDIDARALDHACQPLPAPVRSRVHRHAPVDLTGCLAQLDRWGDELPDEAALRAWAGEAAAALIARIGGGGFDLVLSACLLSQLCHPFQNSWALTGPEWSRLFAAVTRVHLASVAGLVRPGGTGLIACDVLSYAGAEVRAIAAEVPRPLLPEALLSAISRGQLVRNPDPGMLVAALQAQLGEAIEPPRITEPWLWDLGPAVQLVYAVLFRRTEAHLPPERLQKPLAGPAPAGPASAAATWSGPAGRAPRT
jgi:hypothetical protein